MDGKTPAAFSAETLAGHLKNGLHRVSSAGRGWHFWVGVRGIGGGSHRPAKSFADAAAQAPGMGSRPTR